MMFENDLDKETKKKIVRIKRKAGQIDMKFGETLLLKEYWEIIPTLKNMLCCSCPLCERVEEPCKCRYYCRITGDERFDKSMCILPKEDRKTLEGKKINKMVWVE